MKIYPIPKTTITKTVKQTLTSLPEIKKADKKDIFAGFDILKNLERRAEDMSPDEYIKARTYLSQQIFSHMRHGKL